MTRSAERCRLCIAADLCKGTAIDRIAGKRVRTCLAMRAEHLVDWPILPVGRPPVDRVRPGRSQHSITVNSRTRSRAVMNEVLRPLRFAAIGQRHRRHVHRVFDCSGGQQRRGGRREPDRHDEAENGRPLALGRPGRLGDLRGPHVPGRRRRADDPCGHRHPDVHGAGDLRARRRGRCIAFATLARSRAISTRAPSTVRRSTSTFSTGTCYAAFRTSTGRVTSSRPATSSAYCGTSELTCHHPSFVRIAAASSWPTR